MVEVTYGWRSWRDPLREAPIAVAVAWAFTLIESGARNEFPPGHTLVRNAILGVAIVMLSRGLETMLSWAIEQSRVPLLFRTIVYALGAWLGFFLGLVTVAMLYGAEESDFRFHSFHFIYSMTAAVLLGSMVGLVMHHNQKRKDRLLAAQARLREHEFAEKELEIARSVQQRLLPPPEIDANGFHVSARTEAAHIIGGDFYDVVRLDDGSLAVIVADVSGKGMAASLIMASCKAAVSLLATSARETVDVMRALNAKLCDDLQKREFVAMVYVHCDPSRSRIEIVNAGMPDPLLINNGSCRAVVCGGDRLPLGIRLNRHYEKVSVDLGHGDRLLLFSDGLPEALVNGDPLGYVRVEEFAARAQSIDDLLGSVRAIPGISVEDDATAVVISRSPDRPQQS
jgi:serine phosphatase RsbU (regulator of sigma subunit)